ncbi:hypothetical protein M1R55_20360 (plasmid) [Deinococcus sp. QL22]|nr:hypothetical protein [Deinococcus sp. QL22]UQN08946.1 hypothetical protein M1R55_20360 [Deinococcus sp. QL22]
MLEVHDLNFGQHSPGGAFAHPRDPREQLFLTSQLMMRQDVFVQTQVYLLNFQIEVGDMSVKRRTSIDMFCAFHMVEFLLPGRLELLQKMNQSSQGLAFGGRWVPSCILREMQRFGLVRFVPAHSAQPIGLAAGWVHHTDRVESGMEVRGQRQLIPAGGLHIEVASRRRMGGQPSGQRFEPSSGVGKHLVALNSPLKEHRIKSRLADVDSKGQRIPDAGKGRAPRSRLHLQAHSSRRAIDSVRPPELGEGERIS